MRVTVSGAAAKERDTHARSGGALPVELPLTGGDAKGVVVRCLYWAARSPIPAGRYRRGRNSHPVRAATARACPGRATHCCRHRLTGRGRAAGGRTLSQTRVVPSVDTSQPRCSPHGGVGSARLRRAGRAGASRSRSRSSGCCAGRRDGLAVRADAKTAGGWPWRREGPTGCCGTTWRGPGRRGRGRIRADVRMGARLAGSVRRQAVSRRWYRDPPAAVRSGGRATPSGRGWRFARSRDGRGRGVGREPAAGAPRGGEVVVRDPVRDSHSATGGLPFGTTIRRGDAPLCRPDSSRPIHPTSGKRPGRASHL